MAILLATVRKAGIILKKKLLLSCLVFACTGTCAQRVAVYNRTINQAELKIVDEHFGEACALYKQAIHYSNGKAFGKDLVNAFHCAMECRQYKDAEVYLKIILANGISRESIELSLLKWYTDKNRNNIECWIKKYPNDSVKTGKLARQIDRLFTNDQENRHLSNARRDDRQLQDSLNRADSVIAKQLYDAFTAYGPPDIREVGYLDMNPVSQPVYWIIVLHNSQGYDGYTQSHLFDTMLYSSIKDWKFTLPEFLTLLDNSDLYSRKPPCIDMDTLRICYPIIPNILQLGMNADSARFYLERYSLATEQRMDKLRGLFGMETVAMTNKKFEYAVRQCHDPYGGKYRLLQFAGDIVVYLKKEQLDARLQQMLKE